MHTQALEAFSALKRALELVGPGLPPTGCHAADAIRRIAVCRNSLVEPGPVRPGALGSFVGA
ncbi:hypothetical protein Acsp03_45890 [Actinomadura sp. NBRC 104412]|nr:hypothetical protein Acsp03_45890 [Actinomadura sp. NBRC 104412]